MKGGGECEGCGEKIQEEGRVNHEGKAGGDAGKSTINERVGWRELTISQRTHKLVKKHLRRFFFF